MLEEKTVLIDLGIEKSGKVTRGDNIIRQRRPVIVDIVGIVEIPLLLLLLDLLYHGQRNPMLFSRVVRSPAVVEEISIYPLLTMQLGKFAHALREGNGTTFLLQRPYISGI